MIPRRFNSVAVCAAVWREKLHNNRGWVTESRTTTNARQAFIAAGSRAATEGNKSCGAMAQVLANL